MIDVDVLLLRLGLSERCQAAAYDAGADSIGEPVVLADYRHDAARHHEQKRPALICHPLFFHAVFIGSIS